MRIVTSPNFCKVCLEGLWYSLLRRVDLIDDLEVECSSQAGGTGFLRTANLKLVPLAQFRADAVTANESYSVTWYKDGKVLDAADDDRIASAMGAADIVLGDSTSGGGLSDSFGSVVLMKNTKIAPLPGYPLALMSPPCS